MSKKRRKVVSIHFHESKGMYLDAEVLPDLSLRLPFGLSVESHETDEEILKRGCMDKTGYKVLKSKEVCHSSKEHEDTIYYLILRSHGEFDSDAGRTFNEEGIQINIVPQPVTPHLLESFSVDDAEAIKKALGIQYGEDYFAKHSDLLVDVILESQKRRISHQRKSH